MICVGTLMLASRATVVSRWISAHASIDATLAIDVTSTEPHGALTFLLERRLGDDVAVAQASRRIEVAGRSSVGLGRFDGAPFRVRFESEAGAPMRVRFRLDLPSPAARCEPDASPGRADAPDRANTPGEPEPSPDPPAEAP